MSSLLIGYGAVRDQIAKLIEIDLRAASECNAKPGAPYGVPHPQPASRIARECTS